MRVRCEGEKGVCVSIKRLSPLCSAACTYLPLPPHRPLAIRILNKIVDILVVVPDLLLLWGRVKEVLGAHTGAACVQV